MKKRILYTLLFAVPGFFFSLIIAFALTGFAAGFFWIFVFGDNPWPESIGIILPVLMILFFLVPWIISIWVGFTTGKRFEAEPELNKKHIWASMCLTFAAILLITLHQLNVGNIGPKTDGQLCREFCQQKGYSGSAMVPTESNDKSCACFDDSGREVLNLPIETELIENISQPDQPDESETDYYCRVIFQGSRPINLIYQDETLAITPTLFEFDDKSGALFAAVGSARAVAAFVNEVVLKVNGVAQESSFSLNSVETGCGQDVHFIEVRAPDFNKHSEAEVEMLIPSIKAMFDAKLHTLSAHQD
jgi:hypothetical protein